MAKDVYKIVSEYYRDKGLDVDEFSNRLFAVRCVIRRNWTIANCINFLDIREHWWELDKGDRNRVKNRTRYQLKTILKKVGFDEPKPQ